MSRIEIRGINVLAVYVSDLERSKTFYTEILGFEEGDEVAPGILLKSGEVTLYLEAGRLERGVRTGNLPEFSPCFETESVRRTFEEMILSDVSIVEEYQEYGPAFALFKIADPDGNLIEFAGEP